MIDRTDSPAMSPAMDAAELKTAMDFARRLADASAAFIRQYYRQDYQVELKDDLSPVTIADRGAEEIMREMIMREFPTHGVLGEEFGHHQPEARDQWVLDPIDGTKNFVAGSYLFGTLIALVRDGRPVVGVINQPIVNDFLIGNGTGAWLNDRPVRVRDCTRLEDAILLNTLHWNVGQHHDGAAFEQLTRRVSRYNNWGDCHGYFLVATGGADIMTDPIMNAWDLMALVPIIQGAGGRITDWHGNDPVGGQGIVATGGRIHNAVIAALNPRAGATR